MSFLHGPSKDPGASNNDRSGGAAVPPLILIVEDNLVNQRVARHQVEGLGCRVHIANNGLEAVDLVRQIEYHLILMDCTMPLMDGYEATRALRELDQVKGQHTPIVALTSKAMAGDRQKCLDCGMDDYLHKPVSRDRLKQMLDKWLSGVFAP